MNAKAQLIATDFKRSMQLLWGNRLDRVVLFGSYARGTHRDDSDIDFMVLNDESTSRLDEINRFVETQSELSLKQKFSICVQK